MARQKKGSVICALLVVNRFSFKSVTIGKRQDILSGVGGDSFKSAVIYDGRVAGYFDENIFKTKLETDRAVSFIFPGYDRARRIDIVKAVRLRDRDIRPECGENP